MPAIIETPRLASCSCGKTAPSSSNLPFFESRAAGTQDKSCLCCNYGLVAHERKIRTGEPHLKLVCDNFTPKTEGSATDIFYCGHSGWS